MLIQSSPQAFHMSLEWEEERESPLWISVHKVVQWLFSEVTVDLLCGISDHPGEGNPQKQN